MIGRALLTPVYVVLMVALWPLEWNVWHDIREHRARRER